MAGKVSILSCSLKEQRRNEAVYKAGSRTLAVPFGDHREPNRCDKGPVPNWVPVKQLSLSYNVGETLLWTICIFIYPLW